MELSTSMQVHVAINFSSGRFIFYLLNKYLGDSSYPISGWRIRLTDISDNYRLENKLSDNYPIDILGLRNFRPFLSVMYGTEIYRIIYPI